jgi:hypothetical protein
MDNRSNAQLAIDVMEYARNLFNAHRGYGLSLQEQADIEFAAYGAFNHAFVQQMKITEERARA